MLHAGVEINLNQIFCGVPYQSRLYYQLVYEYFCAIKQYDISHPWPLLANGHRPITATIIHYDRIGDQTDGFYADMQATAVPSLCKVNWHDRTLNGVTQTTIPVDCFGFSYHPDNNPLDNPNWPGSGVIGLRQALYRTNLGHISTEAGR